MGHLMVFPWQGAGTDQAGFKLDALGSRTGRHPDKADGEGHPRVTAGHGVLSKNGRGSPDPDALHAGQGLRGRKVIMLYRIVYRNFCPNTHWLKSFAISPI